MHHGWNGESDVSLNHLTASQYPHSSFLERNSASVSDQNNLIFNDERFHDLQVRWRLRAAEGIDSFGIEKVSPQAVLPVPTDSFSQIQISSDVGSREFTILNEEDCNRLFTGNKIKSVSGLICRCPEVYVNKTASNKIRVASSLEYAYETEDVYFLQSDAESYIVTLSVDNVEEEIVLDSKTVEDYYGGEDTLFLQDKGGFSTGDSCLVSLWSPVSESHNLTFTKGETVVSTTCSLTGLEKIDLRRT